MYVRLTGMLDSVEDGIAIVDTGPFAYGILIPACDAPRLAMRTGETITFHTLHYVESQGQGATLLPRLIGFASETDRAFFELFTTVKGVGYRKALRALSIPSCEVARAIDLRDTDLLQTLKEIGKRTAQTIVAELHGKVDAYLVETGGTGESAAVPITAVTAEALAVLVQLGEPRSRAERLVSHVMPSLPDDCTTEDVVAAALNVTPV